MDQFRPHVDKIAHLNQKSWKLHFIESCSLIKL